MPAEAGLKALSLVGLPKRNPARGTTRGRGGERPRAAQPKNPDGTILREARPGEGGHDRERHDPKGTTHQGHDPNGTTQSGTTQRARPRGHDPKGTTHQGHDPNGTTQSGTTQRAQPRGHDQLL